VKLPSTFRAMLNDEKNQIHFDFILPVSEAGKQMIRDIEYYIN
jgi:hypothetical protein